MKGYVAATSVMLFFLSKKYFWSRSEPHARMFAPSDTSHQITPFCGWCGADCLREIKATIELEKPLVLTHEQQEDKGGGPLEQLQAECPDELRGPVYAHPIRWPIK